jgi:hypothetical protein
MPEGNGFVVRPSRTKEDNTARDLKIYMIIELRITRFLDFVDRPLF